MSKYYFHRLLAGKYQHESTKNMQNMQKYAKIYITDDSYVNWENDKIKLS